jgi:hypothetical protein
MGTEAELIEMTALKMTVQERSVVEGEVRDKVEEVVLGAIVAVEVAEARLQQLAMSSFFQSTTFYDGSLVCVCVKPVLAPILCTHVLCDPCKFMIAS